MQKKEISMIDISMMFFFPHQPPLLTINHIAG